jgi:hypothetical protein
MLQSEPNIDNEVSVRVLLTWFLYLPKILTIKFRHDFKIFSFIRMSDTLPPAFLLTIEKTQKEYRIIIDL